ncbi:APC family permease [Nocardia acidivorans]|uniref:APC family permease n=1 Tax=Nocardia acidivorans TaxID=404580 RepID=UPI00082FB125|nr:APC family permease [Nocardia acidivorans]
MTADGKRNTDDSEPALPRLVPVADPRLRRLQGGDAFRLTALGGVAALSLDALSSVAYGPEAIVGALTAAGAAAVRYTLPITIAITVLLLVLVVSYRQVIAVYPEGGGSYAVAKTRLGRPVSLLAAAGLVVDYVLTVAVSLAAGAASLGSVFPFVAEHLVACTLIALAVLTVVNLVGIAESAKVLMLPALLFIVSVAAIVVVGLIRSHPVAVIGADPGGFPATETLGALLLLKAFAAGSSSLTGVEAIANSVPTFRAPAVKRAQHTEMTLGILLGSLLIGLGILIRHHHVLPRGQVTILSQLSAAAFGTGWLFYATSLVITLVLGLAANTSFGGLPVLLSLLAKDNRLPHLFALRAERPVYRYGVVALAMVAALVLVLSQAHTARLLPLYAIGVFIGFTISQTGLVRHWLTDHGRGWVWKMLLNGFGAILTAVAAVVFLFEKFTEGAWLLLVIVPALILLFDRIERYYVRIGVQLGFGTKIPRPHADSRRRVIVVVPVTAISRLTEKALSAAMRMGDEVHPIAIAIDVESTRRLTREWHDWNPGIELRVLPSPHRSMVDPIVGYTRKLCSPEHQVVVLLPRIEPRHARDQLLHNQRVPIILAAVDTHTDAIAATISFEVE